MSTEANDVFRIDSMTLKNFRCFEERTIEFAPQFNVVIGENGSGKTAAVEGLAGAVGSALFPDASPGRHMLEDNDARRVPRATSGLVQIQAQYPVGASVCGASMGHGFRLYQSMDAGKREWAGQDPAPWVLSAQDEGVVFPLIAYYGASRYSQPPTATADDFMEPGPRLQGYYASLVAVPNEMQFLRWAKAQEFVKAQEGQPVPGLDAAKGAVAQCVEGCRDLVYRARDDVLTVDLADGRTLPYNLLSAGERSMLAMVADMAWRCSYLNPDLGADAARETPGVVLIDEIDLHLHPSWQRRVVGDLKRAFPKVQFIVTTHSPFIIQSLEPGELITLDDDDGIPDHEYADRSIEDVVEGVQGVDLPQMSERRRKMFEVAEEYYRLLEEADGADAEEKERIKRQLDELTAPFSDNVAYHAFLHVKRIAAGLGDGDS